MKRWLLYSLPAILFVFLALFLWRGLNQDPRMLPSALVDKPLPEFQLPGLLNAQTYGRESVLGEPFLLNIWATWCPTCAQEHRYLMQLAESGVKIVGVNYKDDLQAAKTWLTQFGNPYHLNFVDQAGEFAIDLGVYGAPETYLIDAQGVVRFRHVGELNEQSWQQSLKPLYEHWR